MNTPRTPFRNARTLALCAVLGLAAVPAARADQWTRGADFGPSRGASTHWAADGNLVDVQIQVDGATAPLYFRAGAYDRHYFQAFRGRNYSLVVRNTTGRRVGVLLAVDGLNVVNGERSRLSRNESMYVLDPYESAVINGWRTSLQDVRRFVFVDEERSYAERTGQANGDMGWIRVLAFREVEQTPWWGALGKVRAPQSDRESGDARARREIQGALPAPQSAPRAQAMPDAMRENAGGEGQSMKSGADAYGGGAAESNPGTGWGERRYDPVQRTTFVAERQATDRITMRYEYASGLQALGIFVRGPRVWERENGQMGFAKPPRW